MVLFLGRCHFEPTFEISSNTKCCIDMTQKAKIVQVKNPKTGRYVKIDREKGRIVSHKKSDGRYKNVPVARKSGK